MNLNACAPARAVNDTREIREKLLFQRGILSLLKDTNLFGPLIDQALEDADDLLERFPARLDDEERVG